MKKSESKSTNPTKINLWLDITLFSAMMLALAPFLTGIAIHEWLSLALIVAAVIHLLLHWSWIVAALGRFLGRLAGQARLNLILNILLFINFTVVMFTGILISREALPLFGITLTPDRTWEFLHRLSADTILYIMGLHVALHWKWLLSTIKRYIVAPVLNLGRASQTPQPASITIVSQESKS